MNYLQQTNSTDFKNLVPNAGHVRYTHPLSYANREMNCGLDNHQWFEPEVYGPNQQNRILMNCARINQQLWNSPLSCQANPRVSIQDIITGKNNKSFSFGCHTDIGMSPLLWNRISPLEPMSDGAKGVQSSKTPYCIAAMNNNQQLANNPQPQTLGRKTGSPEGSLYGCNFCRRNGERREFYQSHVLRDNLGNVVCPVLREHVCEICGQTGNQAHTKAYCPLSNSKKSVGQFRPLAIRLKDTRRDSCGRIRHSH